MPIVWPVLQDVISIHDDLILTYTPLEHIHVVDPGLLESALMRGSVIRVYEQTEDVFVLAAAIGYALAAWHPFANANKRTAFAVVNSFLYANGYELDIIHEEVIDMFEGICTRKYTEEQLSNWLYNNSSAY